MFYFSIQHVNWQFYKINYSFDTVNVPLCLYTPENYMFIPFIRAIFAFVIWYTIFLLANIPMHVFVFLVYW